MNTIKCLFETILNISSPEKKYQLLPPHEPSQKFLSPPGKSLHHSPENIATLLKHFKQLKKISAPLIDTNSTTQRKCYPPVEYPPP